MINLCARLNSTGYGCVATNIFKEFWHRDSDKNLTLFSASKPEITQDIYDNVKSAIHRTNNYDANLPGLKIWHQDSLADRYSNKINSALTFFELNTLQPIEISHMQSVDKLFLASKWAKDICINHGMKNDIEVIPMGVDTSIFRPAPIQGAPYRFFTTGKIEIRKGHDILCELFNSAFTEKDDVELWIKWENPFLSKEDHANWENLYKNSKLGSKINFVQTNTQKDVAHFMQTCHCGIYPTRAEGFGMGILESIACNKPVITTNYSALTEFCNNTNAALVNINGLEKAYDGRWFYGIGEWAHFDKDTDEQFIEHMRYAYNNRLTENRGIEETLSRFNWTKCVDDICLHLGIQKEVI